MKGTFVFGSAAEKQTLDWGTLQWISSPGLTGAAELAVCRVEIFAGKGHGFHRHPNQEEVIHVLEGAMEQWLDGRKTALGPGDSVFVPNGVVHASFNAGSTTLKVLALLAPCAGPDGYELVDVSGEEPWRSLRGQ